MKTNMKLEGKEVVIGLDKLVIGIPYPKKPKVEEDNPSSTTKIIAQYQHQKNEFVSNMKYIESTVKEEIIPFHASYCKNKDLKRYKLYSGIDGNLLCVVSLGFSFGTGVINIQVNPSKLSSKHWVEFQGYLDVLFEDGYHEIYENGVMSHAEFYCDVKDVNLEDYVLIDFGQRGTKHYKGTTYQGGRTAPLVCTMYDKAKELKIEGNLVRIEARIKRRDIRTIDLIESDLYHPLQQFIVISKKNLQLIAQEKGCPKIADKIIEFGLFKAINSAARKSFATLIREHRAPWWDIDVIWQTHRELLQGLKPQNFLK